MVEVTQKNILSSSVNSNLRYKKKQGVITMDLLEIRKEIDRIDTQMVELFEERMELCKNVAKSKIESGKKVFDPDREKQKIESVAALTHNEQNAVGVSELFGQIMTISRKLQYRLMAEHGIVEENQFEEIPEIKKEAKVVFQGIEGSYSYAAMKEFFGETVDYMNVKTFRNAMEVIDEGKAEYAVIPIENSTAGSIAEVYDLLMQFDNHIVGEQILKVKHCLLGVKTGTKDEIKEVYSHPQSFAQCDGYLRKYDWKKTVMENNAVAAKTIADEKDRTKVAIASRYAGELYGLNVMEEGINDNKMNSTRFIIVAKDKKYVKGAKKVSIAFEIPHESGSLYRTLSHFIYNGINLCHIESRPNNEKNWEYRFFIDFEGNLRDEGVKNALSSLQQETNNLVILGNY